MRSIIFMAGAFITIAPLYAECPTLTSSNMAYYICPGSGAYNALPQNAKTNMVYTREANLNPLSVCKAALKAGQVAIKSGEYSGIESHKVAGQLTCRYTIPESWKLKDKEIKLQAAINKPTSFISSTCPTLNYEEVIGLLSGDQIIHWEETAWKVPNLKGTQKLLNMAKGLLSSRASPAGKLVGVIVKEESKSFNHVCTYKYDTVSGAHELILKGSSIME
jgi:hypothetical protein